MKEFDLLSLPDLFQSISDREQSGILKIQKEEQEAIILFVDGTVKLTILPHKRSVLAEGLSRSLDITDEMLEKIFLQQRTTKKTLLQTILDSNFLDPKIKDKDFLLQICTNQVSEDIYELFTWQNITCEFISEYSPEEIRDSELLEFPIALNPHAVLMEAATRQDEWNIINNTISSQKDIPYFICTTSIRPNVPHEDAMQLWKDYPEKETLLNYTNETEESLCQFFCYCCHKELLKARQKDFGKFVQLIQLLHEIDHTYEIIARQRMNTLVFWELILELLESKKIELEVNELKKLINLLELINGIKDFSEILMQMKQTPFEIMKICACLINRKRIGIKIIEELQQMVQWDIIREDTNKCIKIYERIEELGGKNIDTVRWLANAYEKCELSKKAVEKYRELGEIASKKNLHDEAIRSYRHVMEYAPEDLEACEKLLNAYKKSGQRARVAEISTIYAKRLALYDKKKAIMVLNEANRNYPSSSSNIELIANLYLEMGDKENAINTFEILANFMKKKNKIEKVLEAYKKIMFIDPDNIKIQLELAKELVEFGNINEGLEQYKKLGKYLYTYIHSDNPNMEEILNLFIDVCGSITQYEPDSILAREWLVEIYIILQDHATALEILRELLEVVQKGNNLEQLVLILQKIIELDANDFKSRKMLADTLLRQNKKTQAIQEYMCLGIKNYEKNDMRRAREAFDSVIEIDPFNLTARQQRAKILNHLNLQAKAVEEFRLAGYLAKSVEMIPEAIQAFSQVAELAGDKEVWSYLEVAKLSEILQENNKAIEYYKVYAQKNSHRGNYGEVNSTCEKILKLIPNDIEAKKMKQKATEKFSQLKQYLPKLTVL
ncbi:MAG: DUF4388 domain-containing protein [Planctomycetes bacterium]|nr:DUF4388 domain-containing protein [Planctomycetota bacterium]HPY73789.1 DUF4388 domain-containing protein [Planctomycetota bacterium]HQA99509.1 DUF4388 domain-containing protein [Planctomycetota bacterium]